MSTNFQYPLVRIRSCRSCLCLFPPLSPIISVLLYIFPSITCCIRQFLHKMWPIQFAFHLFAVCVIFLSSLSLCNISSFLTRSLQLICILLQHHISKLPGLFLIYFPKCPSFSTIQSYDPNVAYYEFISFNSYLAPTHAQYIFFKKTHYTNTIKSVN